MENSSESLGLQYHGRSISLPSRLHPGAIRIEAELNKLRSFEDSSVSFSNTLSREALQSGLVGLAELYNSAQELMESSTTQAALLQYQHGMVLEEALERSVELLDSCGAIRDLAVTIKEHVQKLQSALRRRHGDLGVERDISCYLCFRKKVKKEISKSLRALKHLESSGFESSLLLDTDHNLATVIRVLREVTSITISILRSLLVFLSSPAPKTKSGRWSLIAKLILTKSAAPESGNIVGVVGCIDIALIALHARIRNNDTTADVQMAKKRLQMLDNSIEGIETGLECLFRKLVRSRVTLLNILTQ